LWSLLLFPVAGLAWKPGPPVSGPGLTPQMQALLAQLADEDLTVRRKAMQALEALDEPALPGLRHLAQTHSDPDVRLRAAVVARAILDRYWGQEKVLGAGAELRVAPPGLGYWFNRVVFTADGKQALVGGGGLILFDLETGREVRRTLEVGGARRGLALSADGKHCLTGHTNDPVVHLVGVPSLAIEHKLVGHRSGVLAVALTPDASRAASSDGLGQILLWDARNGKESRRIVSSGEPAFSLAFSTDGKRLLSGHQPRGTAPPLHLWDVDTGKEIRNFLVPEKPAVVMGVRFLPDGKRGISAAMDGSVRVWDLETGKQLYSLPHPGGAYDLAVSADGRRAVTPGYGDRCVRLWDLEGGKLLHVFDGHVAPVLGVGVSADGKRAVSCDAVSAVRVWKMGK
jgi:WD40 repeat protein